MGSGVTKSTFPDELGRTVNELTVRQARLQTQASTGQRIRNAEDDPSAFLNVLELQGDFQKLGQYSDNVSKLQTRSEAIYSATSQLKKMTDRASELATMANSIRTADDYAAYSSEVNQLLENSVALANSKHDSEALFGGTSGVDVAFEAVRDADGNITSVAYKGNAKARQMDIASGVSFSIDFPGANESSSGPRGLLKDERAGIDVFGHLIALRDSLKSGDKAWWAPNAGFIKQTSRDPLFAGVTIPPLPGRGQAQAITTKTLVIYGTGRSGGLPGEPPKLYALDKNTGKTVGTVQIPAKTTAVPMTFLHKGQQYIVFATGAEENTSLVAMKLPK